MHAFPVKDDGALVATTAAAATLVPRYRRALANAVADGIAAHFHVRVSAMAWLRRVLTLSGA